MIRAVRRAFDAEIMDGDNLPEELRVRAHQGLNRIHKYVGNTSALIAQLRRDPLQVRRVLDVGCGYGGMLLEVRRQLGVEVVGVDLRPPKTGAVPFPIFRANAVCDPLPEADVAISACFAHHLSEEELVKVIRNVGRSCRTFIILDLVRHPLPLALFRIFVAPLVSRVNSADGRLSIRRAYTPEELRAVTLKAVAGTRASVRQTVAPLYVRQLMVISYQS
jgi:SAM-dependent methyltransferase